jgi:hypothetical protein
MGRPKKYDSAAARQAAYRARQRAAEGKPEPITPAQKRAADGKTDSAVVAAIRASLIKRGAVALAERLYPLRDGVIHRAPETPRSESRVSSPVQM